ncbi:MAG TPA: sigma-70 family RNA polymerase sigma factor [Thermoguttaceae bacterium]|nr:sigma-70 family RNA polymerase sigma factor [Thermoguttaceae bacterium]
MDSREENALVRKLARGDEAAWEAFCGEYSAVLVQFVRLAFGCGREKSEEIVQMTFLRCVRSIGTFDPARGRLFPWLKAVARNEARSCLRGDLRGGVELLLSAVPQHVLDRLADAIDRAPLPDELLARQDTQMLIRECLTELNTRYRQVLLWKYVEERTVARIAVRLRVSEKAAESLLSRARESFRNALLLKLASKRLQRAEILE